MKNFMLGILSILVIVLSIMLIYIWNTDYTYCISDSFCTHQKIGDYLLGKD